MKILFYIASSINGCIADKNGDTNWSTEDNIGYLKKCDEVRAIVMGRKTYEEYLSLPPNEWPNPKGPTVVLTSQTNLPKNKYELYFSPDGPRGAVSILEKLGKQTILVIGGNQTWTSFLVEKFVDRVYLDIEPLVYGRGINLFSGTDITTNLELIEFRPLSSQTIQLHYRVKK